MAIRRPSSYPNDSPDRPIPNPSTATSCRRCLRVGVSFLTVRMQSDLETFTGFSTAMTVTTANACSPCAEAVSGAGLYQVRHVEEGIWCNAMSDSDSSGVH